MKKRRRGRGGREGQRMTGKDEELGEREKKKEQEQEQEEEEGSLSSSSHICILICIIPVSLNFS